MKRLKPRKKYIISNLLIRRCIAFALDELICMAPFSAIVLLILALTGADRHMTVALIIVGSVLMMTVLICKDVLRPSIGKRIMRLELRTADGSEKAELTTGRLICRNLTIGLWLIEVIVMLRTSGEQRMMDKVYGVSVRCID